MDRYRMTDCILCKITPILASSTDLFLIDVPEIEASHYSTVNSIRSEELRPENFKTNTAFTPGARLKMELTEAIEILNHKKVWEIFITLNSPHAIVLNNKKDAEDRQLSIFIENKEVPKDWDIILVSSNQYILTKRAARILLASTRQISNNLETYLLSFEALKVLPLKAAVKKHT